MGKFIRPEFIDPSGVVLRMTGPVHVDGLGPSLEIEMEEWFSDVSSRFYFTSLVSQGQTRFKAIFRLRADKYLFKIEGEDLDGAVQRCTETVEFRKWLIKNRL